MSAYGLGLDKRDYKKECESKSLLTSFKLDNLYQLYANLVSTKGDICDITDACCVAVGENFGTADAYLEVHCRILADILTLPST